MYEFFVYLTIGWMVLWLVCGFIGFIYLGIVLSNKAVWVFIDYRIGWKKALPLYQRLLYFKLRNPDYFEDDFIAEFDDVYRKARLYDLSEMKEIDNGRD